MSKQTFDLGDKDCALIIKQDMVTEMVLPIFEPDVLVSWEENQNMFLTIAIRAVMDQDDFRKIIADKIEEIMTGMSPDEDPSVADAEIEDESVV